MSTQLDRVATSLENIAKNQTERDAHINQLKSKIHQTLDDAKLTLGALVINDTTPNEEFDTGNNQGVVECPRYIKENKTIYNELIKMGINIDINRKPQDWDELMTVVSYILKNPIRGCIDNSDAEEYIV